MKILKRVTNDLVKQIAQVVGRVEHYSSARSSREGISNPSFTDHILVSCLSKIVLSSVRHQSAVVCLSLCQHCKPTGLQQQNRDGATRNKKKYSSPQPGSNPGPSGNGASALPLSYQALVEE